MIHLKRKKNQVGSYCLMRRKKYKISTIWNYCFMGITCLKYLKNASFSMVLGSEGNDSRSLLTASWKSVRFKAYRSINLAVASLNNLVVPAAASG